MTTASAAIAAWRDRVLSRQRTRRRSWFKGR
jgi:hypothetical protein